MMPAVPRISVLFAAVLALAACGTASSPSASAQASAVSEPASQAPNLSAVVCAAVERPFDPTDIDLTGAWAGDDGGVYYLRQVGSVVWWNGMSGRDGSPLDLGRDWNNVGRGVISGLEIDVEWSDVARGEFLNNGTLVVTIQDDGTGNTQIVTVGDQGDFGNSVWTPCSPIELEVADYVETYGGDARQFADILGFYGCDGLADVKNDVTTTLNTAEAGSPEFRAALGYSNAISERESALAC
jgi:hypothetical protein